jgi:hypothetical protein
MPPLLAVHWPRRARRLGSSRSAAARPCALRTTRAASSQPASCDARACRVRRGGRHLVGREAAAAGGLLASARAWRGSSRSSAARPFIAHGAGGVYTAGIRRRSRVPTAARRPSSRGASGRRCRLPLGLGARAVQVISLGGRAATRVARDAGGVLTAGVRRSSRTPRAACRPPIRGANGHHRLRPVDLGARGGAGHLARRPRGRAHRTRRGRRLHGRLPDAPARAESASAAVISWGERPPPAAAPWPRRARCAGHPARRSAALRIAHDAGGVCTAVFQLRPRSMRAAWRPSTRRARGRRRRLPLCLGARCDAGHITQRPRGRARRARRGRRLHVRLPAEPAHAESDAADCISWGEWVRRRQPPASARARCPGHPARRPRGRAHCARRGRRLPGLFPAAPAHAESVAAAVISWGERPPTLAHYWPRARAAARAISVGGRAAVRVAHDAGGLYTATLGLRPRTLKAARRPSFRGARVRRRRLLIGLDARAARFISLGGRAALRIAHDAGSIYTAGFLRHPRAPSAPRRPAPRGASGRRRLRSSALRVRVARVISLRGRAVLRIAHDATAAYTSS